MLSNPASQRHTRGKDDDDDEKKRKGEDAGT